ncbi:hypothetical protein HPP92_001314 [Vanilla planifolia]|uniref:Scarecrow-like protein 9 n=1 Tax=Vanilla planifolia TaxID=51239 RepID=A0A835SCQ0_VANPL|nr:hypothetical protein HPP92_001314 [Vanilla planifolia]
MDRGRKDRSGVDGLDYENFFSYRNSGEGGRFKVSRPQSSVMGSTNSDGPSLEASQLFLGQNNLHRRKVAVAPYVNHNNHSNPAVLSSPALSVSASNDNPSSTSSTSHEGESSEDSEIFSDIVLSYISRMLMEEDVDEKINLLYLEKGALQATEKPFYDILGQKYPPLSLDQLPVRQNWCLESTQESSSSHDVHSGDSCSSGIVNYRWLQDSSEKSRTQLNSSSIEYSNTTLVSHSSVGSVIDQLAITDLLNESQSAWQFRKGMEEAQKFLPDENKLVANPGVSKEKIFPFDFNGYKIEEQQSPAFIRSRERKKPQIEDLDLQEGRSIKQTAVYSEEVVRSEMFDEVLLCHAGKRCGDNKMNDHLAVMHGGAVKNSHNTQNKFPYNGGKGRGKRQQKKDVVDLRTLLIHCAQAVAADDRRTANELLKQIRQYSSPFGDGTQRLAHCFADGLEARLAGTGSQIYNSLVAKRTTTTDILKAYQLYLAACPFKKISHFFSNQTILNVSEKKSRVHIIDFGIYFGFQWPCLIQRLSLRPGGPPKLRITGVDVPQPGFRPTERIEETGKRLADYAKTFNVPFEYNAIASKWETICVEDLKIDEDEVLIVNCLYRFRNLVDETVVVDSPRNKVLSMIRKANPDVFIHGIVNGSYSAPFFVTRFREALFHFSALFDMLETTVSREDAQRLLIERDLFGREALNVISCEGAARVERPETYKQWQVRNLRAGFVQLPLNPQIMNKARDKVRSCYHSDFVIDEDSRWLLQGWKGRIIYTISTWKPN